MMYGKTFKATAIKHIMQRAVSPLYMYLSFITGRPRLLLFYRPDFRVMLSNQFFSHKICKKYVKSAYLLFTLELELNLTLLMKPAPFIYPTEQTSQLWHELWNELCELCAINFIFYSKKPQNSIKIPLLIVAVLCKLFVWITLCSKGADYTGIVKFNLTLV